ncbi:MAG: prolipoprotein diacylglyceryl transferase [Candidatus Omnitrophica bacterium]|nr:prolipoprotein diacylglyceryl transferase [Candidatus Omnitrophota bacterium]
MFTPLENTPFLKTEIEKKRKGLFFGFNFFPIFLMGFVSRLNPVFLKFGSIEIRYYGLIWLFCFFITLKLLSFLVERKKIGINKEGVSDFVFCVILGGILGARLFYVLVYNFNFYLTHPAEMLAIWHGGLSVHGGFLGGLLGGLIYCHRKKIDFFALADLFVIPLSICLCLGRIGNFINGELYGRISSLPWAVKFPGVEGFRHPSQLYESFKNLIIFAILWNLNKKPLRKGTLFFVFITFYSLFRFLVEFFRQPDSQIGFLGGNLTLGQLLCIPFLLVGIGGLRYLYSKH